MELFNMWANFLLYVSVVDWPPKGKDVLTLWRSVNIWQARRSVASLSSLARLQQINSQTGIYRFSGISAEKISESKTLLSHKRKQEMELFNMRANFLLYASVVNWPPMGKDVFTNINLLIY